MSTWGKVFYVVAVLLLALVALIIIVRLLNPLPSLTGRTAPPPPTYASLTRLGRAIQPEAAKHPGLSGIHAIADPHDALAARIMLARAAERTLDVQYYIWRADRSGLLLLNALREAADRGVHVRLLLDDNNTASLDPLLAELNSHPSIEVRLFNPFVLRSPRLLGYLTDFSRLNRRMHNKSFTADGQATIIGGRNVGDEYFGATDGALFLDLDVLAAGPIAAEVAADFNRYWTSRSAYPAERILPAAKPGDAGAGALLPSVAALIERDPVAGEYLAAIRRTRLVQALVEGSLPLDWAPVRMVSDNPAKGLGVAVPEELVAHKLAQLLGQPQHRLGLVSAYFVPTKAGVAAFADMARQGVDVRILTNALEATDVAIVHAGYAKRRKALLQAGIRLYETRASALGTGEADLQLSTGSSAVLRGSGSVLHAKTFTVDDTRVFVGSFNFDPRSVHLNTEMGFLIESPRLAQTIHQGLTQGVQQRAYEVQLTNDGALCWIERTGGRTIAHETEPGTTAGQRFALWLLSHLPIEWLL